VARYHLVEHHAERPEVGMHVDALGPEPLRRRVGDGAADVGCELAGFLEHLRHPEVEHFAFAGWFDLQMRRLQIVVQQPIGSLFDGRREPVRPIEELEEDFATAKAAGVLPIMAGDKDGVVNFVTQAAMNQYVDPAEFMKWMFNEPGASYDQPGTTEGAELVRDWADKGYFPSDINAIDYATFVTRFSDGEGLFTYNGNWAAAGYQEALGDDVSFFLAPPVGEGDGHVAMGAANSFSVAAGSDNLNEIVYFLNWIHTDPNARQIIVDVTGASPGGDPALPLPEVTPGSLIEKALQMSAQIGAENGQVDFMANTTAGIYAGSIIPESQLLVTSQITGKEFVERVQAFYESEIGG